MNGIFFTIIYSVHPYVRTRKHVLLYIYSKGTTNQTHQEETHHEIKSI